MSNASRPIDAVCERLTVVLGTLPNLRARCPAHGSRGGTLSIREGVDGAVLLKCHAGCTIDAILHSLGLRLRDLFPNANALRRRNAEIAEAKRQFRRAPRATIFDALSRGLKHKRDQILEEEGYQRPLRSSEVNEIRARVSKIFDVKLKPLDPWPHEFFPHCGDPEWRWIFERRVREVLVEKYSDPEREASPGELHVAACRAAEDLHDLARHPG